jgi:hypothetical protein
MDKAQVEGGPVPYYSERGIGVNMSEYTYVRRRGYRSGQCRVPAADSQLRTSGTQYQKA